ncbi:hypothetical protein ASH00_14430 [Arthrobacter sp. Soil782]|nr:hypothetical protein ASH00_14430 [Arthrobacter sp. Soil782]
MHDLVARVRWVFRGQGDFRAAGNAQCEFGKMDRHGFPQMVDVVVSLPFRMHLDTHLARQ